MKLTPQILAMYLGCKIITKSGREMTLTGVDRGQVCTEYDSPFARLPQELIDRGVQPKMLCSNFDIENVKPILRRLESINEDEAKELLKTLSLEIPTIKELKDWSYDGSYKKYLQTRDDECMLTLIQQAVGNPEATLYLLSKHFDLFGLIESGEAIEQAPSN